MATVSEILGNVYNYVNRPNQDKLSLGMVLPLLLDSINFYSVDLELSDENFLLQNQTFVPTAQIGLVTAPSFSAPVAIEVRDIDSTSEADWQGLNIANASDVQDMGRDGQKVVAFFGKPPQMRWSFDPTSDWLVEARLWYQPAVSLPSALSDSPQISQAFHAMIAIRTALLCVPHIGLPDASQLTATLMAQLAQWEAKWRTWNYIDRNAKPIQKRDFRGPRTRGNRSGRSGYWW
jgi:hypothetical protein